MRKKKKAGRWIVGFLLLLGLPAWWIMQPDATSYYLVERVVDGDTIVINYQDASTKVRLIGVDTPETVHPNKPVEFYGKEASTFLRNLLIGEMVSLDFEQTRKDRYGRLLAYVYRDGLFVNREILRQGYGIRTTFKFKHAEDFKNVEAVAKELRKGLWRR